MRIVEADHLDVLHTTVNFSLFSEADKVTHHLGVNKVESFQDLLDVVVKMPNLRHIKLGQVCFAFIAFLVNLDRNERGIGLLDLTIFFVTRIIFEVRKSFLGVERNNTNVVGQFVPFGNL